MEERRGGRIDSVQEVQLWRVVDKRDWKAQAGEVEVWRRRWMRKSRVQVEVQPTAGLR